MLLLIILFSLVLCLLVYSLSADRGKNTRYAREDYHSVMSQPIPSEPIKPSSDSSSPHVA